MVLRNSTDDRLVRCAIYTRKSTSAGLDQPVNSLETQREVCRAYIKCQQHRNWVEVPQVYDDGGYSGGTLKRPALQRLLDDIEANRIDQIVIYKIDRISRSLTDFVRLMDVFDRYDVSFVSVTQTFDTSDSMGRLVLNILLTFAQFERELAGERIRDRYEEKRRRGLFPGGCPPIGYLVQRGRLVLDPKRAEAIRRLFLDFPTMTASALAKRLAAEGFTTRMYVGRHGEARGGQKLWGYQILQILRNPVYAGYCFRRGELVQAQIEPLITLSQWQRVQELAQARLTPARDTDTNFLLGILFDELGRPMRVRSSGQGRSPRVRHYQSKAATGRTGYAPQRVTVEAERIEKLAVSMLQSLLTDRVKLKETVLRLGDYSGEIARCLGKGGLAARRVSRMDGKELRELFLALVPRVEVAETQLRMLVCSFELRRFLAWDGTGLFRKSEARPRGSDRFRMLYAPAVLHCGNSRYLVPVEPNTAGPVNQSADLIQLLRRAAELKEVVLSNRSKSIAQLAHARHLGPVHFSRILRVNYLAPDIQAAIMDGTQPADLTPHKILFSALPLDWAQQRHLLGFETCQTSGFAAILVGRRERKDSINRKLAAHTYHAKSNCLIPVE